MYPGHYLAAVTKTSSTFAWGFAKVQMRAGYIANTPRVQLGTTA